MIGRSSATSRDTTYYYLLTYYYLPLIMYFTVSQVFRLRMGLFSELQCLLMRETKSSIPVSTRLFLSADKVTMSLGSKSARNVIFNSVMSCCGEFGRTAHKNFKTIKTI